jgi:hypothetical protein
MGGRSADVSYVLRSEDALRVRQVAGVKDVIEHNMKAALEDWELYRAIKENRTI